MKYAIRVRDDCKVCKATCYLSVITVFLFDNWSILFHCYQFTSNVVIMKRSMYKMYNRDRRAIAPLHKEESNLDGTPLMGIHYVSQNHHIYKCLAFNDSDSMQYACLHVRFNLHCLNNYRKFLVIFGCELKTCLNLLSLIIDTQTNDHQLRVYFNPIGAGGTMCLHFFQKAISP